MDRDLIDRLLQECDRREQYYLNQIVSGTKYRNLVREERQLLLSLRDDPNAYLIETKSNDVPHAFFRP